MDHIARRLVLFGVAMIGLLALAACGGGEPTPTTTPVAQPTPTPIVSEGGAQGSEVSLLAVSGAEYSFDAPDRIAAGRTTLRFTNEGQESHELQVMRLKDGVSEEQFQTALHRDGLEAALQMASGENRIAAIGPAQTAEATVELAEGKYVLICLIPSPGDGVAHALKGMAKVLTVTAAP